MEKPIEYGYFMHLCSAFYVLLHVNKQELEWNNLPIIDGLWCVWVSQTVVHQARVHVWGAQQTHLQVQRSPLK